ncbi:hypothetical protein CEXT_118431 [Caerostris extrusa]|uniref:Ycf15 n=1 Tax=Caerostris extrusa TaxID=172846 RepID=A0AAV4UFV9_CAEEX|nr:hypothetical protein CEXT_118431 [Caerostris extrusa]
MYINLNRFDQLNESNSTEEIRKENDSSRESRVSNALLLRFPHFPGDHRYRECDVLNAPRPPGCFASRLWHLFLSPRVVKGSRKKGHNG